MARPPATLRELVELSELDPYQPVRHGPIPTLGETILRLGEKFIDSEVSSSLVREAATFPGNQTTFVNIDSGTTSRHVSISEELDARIFNRRLLIRLYDADYPNPESCAELKNILWKSECHYLPFASGDDLQKLFHIRVLDHFLAGSVARRAVRSAAERARREKMENLKTEQRFDAIRASWPESRFQSLDAYMNHQHDMSEQILTGSVDIHKSDQPMQLPPDSRLGQARDVQVLRDTRTAKELVDISKQFRNLGLQDIRQRQDLSEKQASSAQQLVVINSMISALDISTTERPPTPPTARPTDPAETESPRPETPSPTPVTARRGGYFQNINWQDVRPFTPTTPQHRRSPRIMNGDRKHLFENANRSIMPELLKLQSPSQGLLPGSSTSTTNLPPTQAGPNATEASQAPLPNVTQGLVGTPYPTPPTPTYLTANQPYVSRYPAMFTPPMQPYYAPGYWQPVPLMYRPPPALYYPPPMHHARPWQTEAPAHAPTAPRALLEKKKAK